MCLNQGAGRVFSWLTTKSGACQARVASSCVGTRPADHAREHDKRTLLAFSEPRSVHSQVFCIHRKVTCMPLHHAQIRGRVTYEAVPVEGDGGVEVMHVVQVLVEQRDAQVDAVIGAHKA